MPIHTDVLDSANSICRSRGGWTFRPAELVAALPDRNASSVRTHLMSRCCVNAPAHHSHRWPYFRRLRRGVYEILPAWRRAEGPSPRRASRSSAQHPEQTPRIEFEVRETSRGYTATSPDLPRPVEGATLDSLARSVRDLARQQLGGGTGSGVHLRIDLDVGSPDPVLAAYERGIDRTQIRENLRSSVERRLEDLEHWMNAMDEIRGAAGRAEEESR